MSLPDHIVIYRGDGTEDDPSTILEIDWNNRSSHLYRSQGKPGYMGSTIWHPIDNDECIEIPFDDAPALIKALQRIEKEILKL